MPGRLRALARYIHGLCHAVIIVYLGLTFILYNAGFLSYEYTVNPFWFYQSIDIAIVFAISAFVAKIVQFRDVYGSLTEFVIVSIYLLYLIPSSYILRVPYPIAEIPIGGNESLVFAANNAFTFNGFSVFRAGDNRRLIFERAVDRDLNISDGFDVNKLKFTITDSKDRVIISADGSQIDCLYLGHSKISVCD